MKISDIKNIKAAIKYSKALYLTALENNIAEKIKTDLFFILETLRINAELNDFLNSPLIKKEDKKDVVRRLFSSHTDKVLTDFISILIDADRFNTINKIAEEYNEIYDKNRDIIKPLIISAVELDSEQRKQIENKLALKMNKKIEAEYTVEREIIGGLIIEIGDRTIDFSIKTKFDNMQKELIKGN